MRPRAAPAQVLPEQLLARWLQQGTSCPHFTPDSVFRLAAHLAVAAGLRRCPASTGVQVRTAATGQPRVQLFRGESNYTSFCDTGLDAPIVRTPASDPLLNLFGTEIAFESQLREFNNLIVTRKSQCNQLPLAEAVDLWVPCLRSQYLQS